MKIAVFEIEDWERNGFSGLSEKHDVMFFEQALSEENADKAGDADIVSTFIYSKYDCNILGELSRLKMIATRSTGYDHIDLKECNRRDISVCNVPSYGENTVAEHVFGLLLSISHNLPAAIDRTRKGDFSQVGLRGFDLEGRTLGIIGTGAIGQCVAKIASGFQMKVLAYDVKPSDELAKSLDFKYVDLEQLLKNSDIITLHVPSTKKTHHLLASDQFDMMKKDVVLINTARGELIDTQALLRAISEGKVAAAGLDVLPEEPVIREEAELLRHAFSKEHKLDNLLADHILLRLRNVIVTPHSAFNTREAVQRILDTTVENIKAFVDGNPQNVVNG